MTINIVIIAAIAYGILAIIGGIIGYKKVGSKISLVSGSISGLLLIISGIMQLIGINWGLILSIIITTILIITFIIRLAKTRKMMPAGLMILTGIIALAIMVYEISINNSAII
ncbi:TMEM14 family protein [Okeania sp.]|uniref:TMEM14 family protein n=1 Tax=Okeania sp. TaxID=3100323 RepID=UPI002B4AE756|nr:TMEM14 family protein [Okeania sp.]MEB3343072.1 TMEM14 family protein [Okeania sp.]